MSNLFTGPDLVPGALRGYRRWTRITSVGQLVSTGVEHFWRREPYQEPERAACNTHFSFYQCEPHQVPNRKHSCGIYGWYDPADSRIPLAGTEGTIFGVVEATGRVIMGTHGFRAEKVRVVAVASENPNVRADLAYHGFEVYPSEAALAEAYPPEDVSGLIDHTCDGSCIRDASAPIFVFTSAGMSQGFLQPSRAMQTQHWSSFAQRFATGVPSQHQNHVHLPWYPQHNDEPTRVKPTPSPTGPVHGPLTREQALLEARRNRSTGPTTLPFKNRGKR